jgi:hypothetical protein
MNKIIIAPGFSQEEISKIEMVLKNQMFEYQFLNKNDDLIVVNGTTYEKEKQLLEIVKKMRKTRLLELIQSFFDTFAIEFKKQETELPTFVSIITGDEYDDQSYFLDILDIAFYDSNQEGIYNEVIVPQEGYEDTAENALLELIRIDFTADEIQSILGDNEKIKINHF